MLCRAFLQDYHTDVQGSLMLQAGTEGITQTIRAMVLTAVVQDGHAAEGLEVGRPSPVAVSVLDLYPCMLMIADVHARIQCKSAQRQPSIILAGYPDRGGAGASIWLL